MDKRGEVSRETSYNMAIIVLVISLFFLAVVLITVMYPAITNSNTSQALSSTSCRTVTIPYTTTETYVEQVPKTMFIQRQIIYDRYGYPLSYNPYYLDEDDDYRVWFDRDSISSRGEVKEEVEIEVKNTGRYCREFEVTVQFIPEHASRKTYDKERYICPGETEEFDFSYRHDGDTVRVRYDVDPQSRQRLIRSYTQPHYEVTYDQVVKTRPVTKYRTQVVCN